MSTNSQCFFLRHFKMSTIFCFARCSKCQRKANVCFFLCGFQHVDQARLFCKICRSPLAPSHVKPPCEVRLVVLKAVCPHSVFPSRPTSVRPSFPLCLTSF